jgi:hemerythrin-like domain-containing protein
MAQANSTVDPVALLKEDHKKVKQLFDEFEQATDKRTKHRIAREALIELEVHAGIEEDIFYPAFEAETDDEESETIIAEAEEEHHVVHLLIDELKSMSDDGDGHFEAKFIVLAENVRHHIKEEEDEMLPKAKQLGEERLGQLGEEMAARKQELTKQYKAEIKL